MRGMLFSVTLHRLLLAGVCLCIYSTPVPTLQKYTPSSQDRGCNGQAGEPMKGEPCITQATPASVSSQSVQSGPSGPGRPSYRMSEHLTGNFTYLSKIVGARGGTVPDVEGSKPRGIEPLTQTENGDSRGGVSGPREVGTGAKRQRREAEHVFEEMETLRQPVEAQELRTDKTMDAATTARGSGSDGQTGMHPPGERRDLILEERPDLQGGEVEHRQSLPDPGAVLLGHEIETRRPSSLSPRSLLTHSPLTSVPPSAWGSREASSLLPSGLEDAGHATLRPQDGDTAPALPDPLLPDLGPALTGSSRQDDPDSLWTEPLQQNGAADASPSSLQEAATESTMSSEDLPLIFDPFDDLTPEGAEIATATLSPGNSQPSVAIATTGMLLSEAELDQVVTADANNSGPSRVPPPVLPDWTSPWQTSGADISEPISPSGPPMDSPSSETEQLVHQIDKGYETKHTEKAPPTSEPKLPSTTSTQITMTMSAMSTSMPATKSGLEELESEEELEEDEEDENTEESEEDSEEDLNEPPVPAPTRAPYSLIPPPPVWVQRNQGLMRSWVELIREKAGYVSGMLAPVGIGIAGALLIVGALYSIRMIHRKRRNSFKHQRRRKMKTPETFFHISADEPPREPSSNGQDQAMLLADSSEDEF
ncbi:armadillo-like helical domain-containing protein 4 isoform X2 [Esox lucius]|uniref:armadillo-like helical domain-containing protein 4 isoform X2 n=1 Tax=Esox lucius TaxID=8010 RepID=UPI0014768A46|nr:armadillo-like helical domain-containing protein 4 isoform X2 [Esox lucius]